MTVTNMTKKDEIVRKIMQLVKELADDGSPKLPAAKADVPSVDVGGGWSRALIKALSEKEIETKRGPATKLSLKLAWVENGTATEIWASTFNDEMRSQAAKFDKGDRVEVQLKQSGEFWNLMGIRESV